MKIKLDDKKEYFLNFLETALLCKIFVQEMIGSSDSYTNLIFTNPQFFFTKFAAGFDLLKMNFCLGIKIRMQNNASILRKKPLKIVKKNLNRQDS